MAERKKSEKLQICGSQQDGYLSIFKAKDQGQV